MEEALSQSIPLCTDNYEDICWGFAEMMPYAIYATINGEYIYCNRSGAELLGFSSPEEVRRRCIKEFIPSFLLGNFENTISSPVEKNKIHPIFETKLVKLDGTVIDVEVAVSDFIYKGQIAAYSVVRDITSSNKIKKSLIESERKYKTLVELLPDAVFLRTDDRITYANIAAARDLGYEKPEDIIGRDIRDFITRYPDGHRGYYEYYEKLEGDGYIPFTEECFIRNCDGKVMTRETAVKLVSNVEEPLYLVVSRDISEKKRTEELKIKMEEKNRKLDEAVEYDKLRTEFFTNISHEFRTPLNVMLSALQLTGVVLKDAPASECKDKVTKYMSLMKNNCYRLTRLVNNLIDITRIDTGYFKISPEKCNIVDIIEDITFSVREHMKNKGVKFAFKTDSKEIMMVCDPDKIERIMLNLLSNALKFTDPPGKVEVNVFNKADRVIISVKDTGIGIPKDKETFIFGRFEQVDKSLSRNHEGSGIGLSLVKSLVEMHGGSIRLNNAYNGGSEFIVEFPLNNFLDGRPVDKKRIIDQSKLEKINIELSDIYF